MSMELIYYSTGIFALLFLLIHYSSLRPAMIEAPKGYNKTTATMSFAILLVFAFFLRIIIATSIQGHTFDMNCFRHWSRWAYDDGLHNFYFTDSFTDYPPGYMYVLWFTGWLHSVIPALQNNEATFNLIIKLPAILCDIATAWLIYKMAAKYAANSGFAGNSAQKRSFGRKNISSQTSPSLERSLSSSAHSIGICMAMLFLFNPAILLNSAAWGQVDSVWTLLLLLCIYLLLDKKFVLACTAFVLGALIKPQTGMFALIVAFAAVKMLIDDKSSYKRDSIIKIAMAAGVGIIITFFVALPFAKDFNFQPIIDQYINTVNSYPYGSVNAFNLFWLFGGGWENPSIVPDAETNIGNPFMFMTFGTWSTIFIVLTLAASAWFFMRWLKRSKQNTLGGGIDMPNLYLYAALTILGIFTLAGRMHERYAYPAIALLACAFLYKKDLRTLCLFFAASLLQLLNSGIILYMNAENAIREKLSPPTTYLALSDFKPFVAIIAIANILLLVYLFRLCYNGEKPFGSKTQNSDSGNNSKNPLVAMFARFTEPNGKESGKTGKMVRPDYIIMAAVTLIYSCVALFNLGDMRAPESYWESIDRGNGFTITFDEDTYIEEIKWFTGCYEKRRLQMTTQYINTALPAGVIDPSNMEVETLDLESVFSWHSHRVGDFVHSISFKTLDDKTRINELVFLGENGEIITPGSIEPIGDHIDFAALFDEQGIAPEVISYKNSTHFDEIYHARTAYEFIHGLHPYETTHPPLGKVFISWGIMIFGMNPFGWRIMGTLFGIFMIPLIYLFAKRMFKRTSVAALAAVLFAADFMHFVQTRIATIDVYITFFVILMYYFMYRYYTMNFYKDKLWKTLAMLALSGLFMGLGIASKWTGAYAAIGLAVILFISLGCRWYERHRVMRDSASTSEQRSEVAPFVRNTAITLASCVAFFVIVPALIYGASYTQFNKGWLNEEYRLLEITPSSSESGAPTGYEYLEGKARTMGHYEIQEDGTKEWVYEDAIVDEQTKELLPWAKLRILVHNQVSMYSYHSDLQDGHPYSSEWWKWPLSIRPVWYFSGNTADGQRMTIASFGNPAIWWLGFLAFFAVLIIGILRRDKRALFLIIGYLSQYLPWVPISRATFLYHYFVCVPFLLLMICYCADYLLQLAEKRGRIAARNMHINIWTYAGVCVLLFMVFYPVLSGAPASSGVIDGLKWLKTWTF